VGLTRKRGLRSGQSIWMRRPLKRLAVSRLPSAGSFDVIVVGSGISGALIAQSLAAQKLSVAVVDRRTPLGGSTPASTALLQYEIDTPLSKLSDEIGKERAQRVWRRSKLALDSLRERTRYIGIDADCRNRDSLYLEGNELGPQELHREYLARREAGFETTHLDREQVRKRFGIKNRTALMSYDNMEADPRRLAAGFLREAIRLGAHLYSPYEIASATTSSVGVTLETTEGRTLKAKSVVFASGYEWVKGIPKKGHSIASTWAIATKPQLRRLWPERCFIWEASDPYLYMRISPDNRVICGGCDEDFADAKTRDTLMEAKVTTICKQLGALFPRLDTRPEFKWCGNFGKSRTGTPTIGPIPRMKNCYAVMGFGGNGITFSMLAAQIITAMVLGYEDPDSDLFSFNRTF
jgi:glycine/D-amino acid oxidase-like deaminating enzyme